MAERWEGGAGREENQRRDATEMKMMKLEEEVGGEGDGWEGRKQRVTQEDDDGGKIWNK